MGSSTIGRKGVRRSPSKPWQISYEVKFGASVLTHTAWSSHSVRHALVPLTLIIVNAVPLALVGHFGTLIRVICAALNGLAGLRIAQDHRPCAAGKDNQSPTDGERGDDGDFDRVLPRRYSASPHRAMAACFRFIHFPRRPADFYVAWRRFGRIHCDLVSGRDPFPECPPDRSAQVPVAWVSPRNCLIEHGSRKTDLFLISRGLLCREE